MTLQEQARAADAEGRIEEAARLYETAISADPSQADLLIDLVLLYWQATDNGIWKSKGIDAQFVSMAGKRFPELLDQGRSTLPGNPAVRFWTKYIAWADRGEPLEPDECRALLQEHPEYHEPAMFLFAVSQGSECDTEARRLLLACAQVKTSRCSYLASVIDGVLKRRPHSRK